MEICFDHTVVDLTILVSLPADILLCLVIGRDDVFRPGIKPLERLSDLSVESGQFFFLFQALAVGRVGYVQSVFLLMTEL